MTIILRCGWCIVGCVQHIHFLLARAIGLVELGAAQMILITRGGGGGGGGGEGGHSGSKSVGVRRSKFKTGPKKI